MATGKPKNNIMSRLKSKYKPLLETEIQAAAEKVKPNILEDALQTVGPANRGADYGHPLNNFEMEAQLMNVWLEHRNRKQGLPSNSQIGSYLTAKDMAIHKLFMKITREANRHKRDNSVDLAGYAWCLEEMIEEEARRYGESKV